MVHRFGTRNPFEIANRLGIKVMFRDDFISLKGMYAVFKRTRFIILNANLSVQLKRLVCAHELGHDQLHRYLATNEALKEYLLMDMTTWPENEANIYAAHLLLDEDDIVEFVEDGLDAYQIANELNETYEILLLKMREMNKQGYNFNIPYIPPSDFLGKNKK